MRWFTRDFRRQFTEWPRVIEHVDASPMCRYHQVESARMNLQVVHPHWRQIANPDPVHPLVERGERAEMRARIKQFRIYRIFADYFHRVVRRKVAGNIRPGLPAVRRTRQHRSIVSYPITARGDVTDIRILRTRFDSYDPLVAQWFGQICRQLCPFPTIVLRNPEPAIVSPGPQSSSAHWGFRQ